MADHTAAALLTPEAIEALARFLHGDEVFDQPDVIKLDPPQDGVHTIDTTHQKEAARKYAQAAAQAFLDAQDRTTLASLVEDDVLYGIDDIPTMHTDQAAEDLAAAVVDAMIGPKGRA